MPNGTGWHAPLSYKDVDKIVYLSTVDKVRNVDIAERMGIQPNTVYKILRDYRKVLKKTRKGRKGD